MRVQNVRPPPPRTAIDANVSDMMANYWVNFATPRILTMDPRRPTTSSTHGRQKTFPCGSRSVVCVHGDSLGEHEEGGEKWRKRRFSRDRSRDEQQPKSRPYHRRVPTHAKYAADLQRRMRSKSGSVRKIFNYILSSTSSARFKSWRRLQLQLLEQVQLPILVENSQDAMD